MATARATFMKTEALDVRKKQLNVYDSEEALGLDELTTSGTADNFNESAAEWTSGYDGILRFICDGDVWIDVGPTPTAAVGTSIYAPANEVVDLFVRQGRKVSVIDDT